MSPRWSRILGSLLGLTVVCFFQCVQSSEVCRPAGCLGDGCLVSCEFGTCGADGACECTACYTGTSCDTYVNKHKPEFDVRSFEVDIPVSHDWEKSILNVKSHVKDFDLSETCAGDASCACASIHFSIKNGPWSHLFSIGEYSGDIYSEDLDTYEGETLHVEVEVRNEKEESRPDQRDVATLTVQVMEEEVDWHENENLLGYQDPYSEKVPENSYTPHHRQKRASDYLSAPDFPDNVTFYLEKTGDYENVTDMKVGTKIHFKLAIHFPVDTVDMLVELFTPDNDTTIMMVCDAQITHIGKNLDIPPDFEFEMDSLDYSLNYDRAIGNFGYVTNSGSMSANIESMAFIEWDAVMIENYLTQDQMVYWASVGAEYYNEGIVWVGQASFLAHTIDTEDYGNPTFDFIGPSELQIGTSAAFKVDMYIPYPSTSIAFDAFAPMEDTGEISICGLAVESVALNYQCLQYAHLVPVFTPSATGKGNFFGRLEIGTVTNAGVREIVNPVENNRITMEFVVYVSDDASLIGNEYTISAAVEVGDTKIWAGNMKLPVAASVATSMSEVPDMDMKTMSNRSAAVGDLVILEVDFKPPENTEGTYHLEVLMPFNDSAPVAKICQLSVKSQGVNVPCMSDKLPVFSSRADDKYNMDRAEWSLGRIRNFGLRSTADDPTANSIIFEIVAQIMENPAVNVDDLLWFTAGLTFDGTRMWVGQNAHEYKGVLPVDTSSVPPAIFDMRYAFGDENIPVGGSTQVLYEVQLMPGYTYGPMEIEMIMPENNYAIVSICRAQVLYVGKNLPCVNRAYFNESFTYESVADDGKNDKALLTLGTCCNRATMGTTPSDDDKIILGLDLRVEPVDDNQDGDKHWISGGVTYSNKNMWLGQIAALPTTDDTKGHTMTEEPYIQVSSYDQSNYEIPDSGMAMINILIKLPPMSSTKYGITVTSMSTSLSVCNVRILEVGSSLPCVDKYEFVSIGTVKHADGVRNQVSNLNLGFVSNFGQDPLVLNGTFDNNTLLLQGSFQLSSGQPIGGTHDFEVNVECNQTIILTETGTLTTVAKSVGPTLDIPEVSFYRAALSGNETLEFPLTMSKGESGLFRVDIKPPEFSQYNMVVKFLTPIDYPGAFEISDVNVVHVGENMPCLNREAIEGTLEKRMLSEYNDIGTVNLGTVCQIPVNIAAESQIFTVEGVVRLTHEDVLSVGDKVWLSASLHVNDDQVHMSQLAVEVTGSIDEEDDASGAALSFNLTDPTLLYSPGSVNTVPLVVTTPPNRTFHGLVDVELPVDQSAIMTVQNIKVLSAGRNLGGFMTKSDTFLIPSYVSSQSTTQFDMAFLDLLVLTNTGVTYRTGEYEDGDNDIIIEAEVQMADAVSSIHLSEHWMSFGAKLGPAIAVLETMVTVDRRDDEEPVLCLSASSDVTIRYDDKNEIQLETLLKHSNESTAEAYNVTTAFYLPPTLRYVRMLDNNYTLGDPKLQDAAGGYGVAFLWPRVYFTDIINFTVILAVNRTTEAPSGGDIDADTPYDANYNMVWRQNNVNPEGTYFVTRVDSLTFQIVATGQSDCGDEHLDMESEAIQDCITSPPWYEDLAHPAKDATGKGSSNYWKSHARESPYKKIWQANFGNVTKVKSIYFDNTGAPAQVTKATVFYSDDGYSWSEGDTLSVTVPEIVTLSMQESARYIRLEVDGPAESAIGLRLEFTGCIVTGDKSISDVCQAKPWEVKYPPELNYRGFISMPSTMFFCDLNPDDPDNVKCFSSDDGLTFSAIDSTVMTLLGYSEEDGHLYGIGWDKRTFVCSADLGATWFSVSEKKIKEMKLLNGWKSAREVPWINEADLSSTASEPSAKYIDSNFGAGYHGMYIYDGEWKQVTDWTHCCT